ncbi:MAG: hypothetical protein CL676_03605 [Bdellovibrionaceae bacterium]|nr:hypothetical protein [Pseudobdellovibrionaceae bacterium]|tara:strand:- start:1446 stop:2696 length:1251 start_codon:yes stop_codon:yes gene_type:complete
MNDFKSRLNDVILLFKEWLKQDPKNKWMLGIVSFLLLLFFMTRGEPEARYVFKGEDFKKISKGTTITNPYKSLADDKLALIENAEKSIRKENRAILSEVETLKQGLSELSLKLDGLGKDRTKANVEPEATNVEKEKDSSLTQENVNFGESPLKTGPESFESKPENSPKTPLRHKKKSTRKKIGPYSVVFPVEVKAQDEDTGVVIGKGSRAFGKIIGGAEVPMGETYPVLIQLDYAFVLANNKKVDLKGCVLIAKSETVFATGKMKMEPDSITCYGPNGSLYTQNKIKGWFNDPKDDNFGMSAELKTNAGKKSLGVFGQAFVEGLGAAIERGSRSVGGQGVDVRADVVIQDSGQKAGAKAGQLFMEYLDGLKPTLKVTSGRDAWLILGSELVIPYEFFEQRSEYAKSRGESITEFVR